MGHEEDGGGGDFGLQLEAPNTPNIPSELDGCTA